MINRAVFTYVKTAWQEPFRKGGPGKVNYEHQKSTWNSGMQKTTSRESADEEVRKPRARVTGAWKQISNQK